MHMKKTFFYESWFSGVFLLFTASVWYKYLAVTPKLGWGQEQTTVMTILQQSQQVTCAQLAGVEQHSYQVLPDLDHLIFLQVPN